MKKKTVGKLSLHKASQCWCVRINGKVKYLTKKGGTEEEALLELAKLRVELSKTTGEGGGPDDEKTETLVNLYLDRVKGETSQKNHEDKTRFMNGFLKKHGQKKWKDLTPLHAMDWLGSLGTKSTGAGRRNAYAHLRACIRWLSTVVQTVNNPLRGVKRPDSTVRGEEYLFSDEEFNKIYLDLPADYQPLAMVLWLCGARPSELVNATVDEYRPSEGVIVKKEHKTKKKNKQRIIVLTPRANEIVRTAVADRTSGLIFRGRTGSKLNKQWLNKLIIRAAKKNGREKPACAYSMRHSFAVRHIRRGLAIQLVAGWLGNTVAVCERVYAHTVAQLASLRHLLTDPPSIG